MYYRIVNEEENDPPRLGDEWYCEWDCEWHKLKKSDFTKRGVLKRERDSHYGCFPMRRKINAFTES